MAARDAGARTVRLSIPGTPAYSLSPNARCHWAVKQRETQEARLAVVYGAIPEFPVRFDGQVRLHWTVYLARGGKRRDNDNVLACLKAHQDALVFANVLQGDSPKWIPETPTVEQIVWSKHKGEPRIEVTITEAAAPDPGSAQGG